MAKREKAATKAQLILDTLSAGRGRGRPRKAQASEIYGRAESYRNYFWEHRYDKRKKQNVRDHPQEWAVRMLEATNEDDLRKALEDAPFYIKVQFGNIFPLILSVLREKKFPKTAPARLDYLADSLAGLGNVSTRRSRDVCGIERAKVRRAPQSKIIRHEYYVECSCGYKGPALNNACRKCGAEINMLKDMLSGTGGVEQF